MTLPLRRLIFWWSITSTLIVLAATFFFVDGAFHDSILRVERQNLMAGARLVEGLQRSERDESLDRLVGIATTPTLVAAVETGDSATIRQNLRHHLDGPGMTWLAVATHEGELVAAVGDVDGDEIRRARDVIREARHYDTGDLWAPGGRLVQVYATGILYGARPTAVLLAGAPIGPERVSRLEMATQQRVVFMTSEGIVAGGDQVGGDQWEGFRENWEASGDGGALDGDGVVAGGGDSAVREFALASDPFLGVALPLLDARSEPVGSLVVFRSLEEALAPRDRLRLFLLGIAGLGVLMAFGSSSLLAVRVSRPVNRLLDETRRLGSGDLDHPIRPEREDEIGKLAEGFDTMRMSLREAREELVRAERLSAVGQAASAIVHDVRQPLTVIRFHVGFLGQAEDPSDREQDLAAIETELRRLDAMMAEVLEFARGVETVRPERIGVPRLLEAIRRAVEPALEESRVTLDIEDGTAGDWWLDFDLTQRALENLVRNAVAVSEPGGRVRLRSEETETELHLSVEDRGPGVPEEIRDTLFEPFVTHGKKGGTGLGLAIVRALTERQGGAVHVRTSPEGTTFTLGFPRRGAP